MRRLIVGVLLGLMGAGAAGAQTVQQATVTLTDAQIKALPSTPVEVVGTPASGKAYVLVNVTLNGSFVAAYTNLTGHGWWEDLGLYAQGTYGSGQVSDFTGLDGFLNYTSDRGLVTLGPYQWMKRPASAASFELVALNDTGDFTGGHASNTLTVSVLYYVLDLSTGLFD